jgi:hypothetical protein
LQLMMRKTSRVSHTLLAPFIITHKCLDCVNRESAPLHTVNQMFDHVTDKALTLGFSAALEYALKN